MQTVKRSLWLSAAAAGVIGLLAADAVAQSPGGGCAMGGGMGAMRGGMTSMGMGGPGMMSAGLGGMGLGSGMMPPPPRGMMGQGMGGLGGGQCMGGSTTASTSNSTATTSTGLPSALQASAYSNLASLQTTSTAASSAPPNPLRHINVSAMMKNLDKNNDGTITESEMPVRLRNRLLTADANFDSKVTLAELQAARSSR